MRPDHTPAAQVTQAPLDTAEILRAAFSALAPSDLLARLLDHVEGRA